MGEAKQKKMKWSELVKGLEGIEAGTPLDVEVQRETIPVIFVPGIMGSRLKQGSKKVWDPDDKFFMLKEYGTVFATAAKKKKAIVGDDFDPERLVPYADDADHNQKFAHVPGAAERGWGTVSWGTYGEILLALQNPESWPAPIRAFFDIQVYAVGYNWSASNEHSGKKLKEKIDAYVAEGQKGGGLCRKAILVTHSMGGLVARWAVEKEGARDKLFGVVHGVQPAVGAAAAYWRMKAGFERGKVAGIELPNPAAWVLGTNGEEVTALLGWMPGGLQLLPGPTYKDNGGSSSWLKFHDAEGKELRALPRSDAYGEIYTLDEDEHPEAYWRLIRKQYLLPDEKPAVSPAEAWDKYCTRIEGTKAFHEDLAGKAHPETQVFYGAGKANPTIDRIVFELAPHDWKAIAKENAPAAAQAVARFALLGPASAAGYLAFQAFKRTEWWQSRGAFRLQIKAEDGRELSVDMMHPAELAKLDKDDHGAGAGDGTVPESSGKAIEPSGKAAHGPGAKAKDFLGIEHEPAYHADHRGMLAKAGGWIKEKLGGGKSGPPADNPVSWTLGAVSRLCWQEIKKAKG
jgi:pimeloyl-ACP methyl ester carboxylesterase